MMLYVIMLRYNCNTTPTWDYRRRISGNLPWFTNLLPVEAKQNIDSYESVDNLDETISSISGPLNLAGEETEIQGVYYISVAMIYIPRCL